MGEGCTDGSEGQECSERKLGQLCTEGRVETCVLTKSGRYGTEKCEGQVCS